MGGIYFHHPQVLWLLAAIVPALLLLRLLSRSGMGAWGHAIAVIARSLALAAGVVALAGPAVRSEQKVEPRPPLLLVLTDESDSVASAPGGGAATAVRPAVVAAVARAGATPEALSFAGGVWRAGEPPAATDQTDVERAIDATLEPRIGGDSGAEGGDVILLTDGRSTRGSATDAAARWAARGVRIHVVPVGWERKLPPRLAEVEPPLQSQVGMVSTVRVTSASDLNEPYEVRLVAPSGTVADRRTIATPGRSTSVLRFTPDQSGTFAYTVMTDAAPAASPGGAGAVATVGGGAGDSRKINVSVSGPPRVLVADNFPDEIQGLARALGELKLPVDVVHPDQWPGDLSQYAAVVISDFSGKELTDAQRLALRGYVEQIGGGLVFIGGGNVVASRWERNPLAELLPVKLREPPAKVVQKGRDVAVCFVFDHSGSMEQVLPGSAGGVSKLELVKASVIASLRGLPDNATVCAIAFDTQPHLIVPPTDLSQREQVAKLIDGVGVGGGTDVYPAAREGLERLVRLPGDKYFIVLTDGRTAAPPSPDAWERLARAAKAAGISWTSIAVGADADQTLLQRLANWAGGRYAYCDTGDAIPKVFVEQTEQIRRVAKQESQTFDPRAGAEAHDLGDEVARLVLPKLEGAVPAELKQSARTQLLARDRDVLLASWQFGAGRVAAFTSDAKNAWAKPWLAEQAYPKVWTKVVSSVARSRPKLIANVRSAHAGGRYRYTFEVREGDGRAADDLAYTATVSEAAAPLAPVAPEAGTRAAGGASASVATMPATTQATSVATTWRRRAAGVYEVNFDLPPDGKTYNASILLRRDDRQVIEYRPTMFSPSSLELAETGVDLQACQAIAFAGGGVCSTDLAAIARAVNSRPEHAPVQREKRLAPWFLMAMLALWPIDVWVRKLL